MSHHLPSISWYRARENLHRTVTQHLSIAREQLPLSQVIGRTLASDVTTVLAVPHYDSSAMDGYATAGAPPWQLIYPDYPQDPTANVHRITVDLTPGTATPIFTGGLLPAGATSILRSEHSRSFIRDGHSYIEPLGEAPREGADMRRTGEERAAGATLATAGTTLTPRLGASLAMGGIDTVDVFNPVTVAVAFSGNEVITSGVPGPGQVRDAFSSFAEPLLEAYGAQVARTERLADTPGAFDTWISSTDAQILMVTGGSSTSGVDMVRSTLARLQATYIFESVAVRPGHPALAALLPDGRILLGLPGNPFAAYTALCSYVPVALDAAYSRPLSTLATAPIAAAHPGTGKQSIALQPARWQAGALHVLKRSQSHMLGGFARADVLAVVPAQGAATGEQVGYLPLP
ncbi:molybdopterin-binding protein [Rothia sp. ZJ932]|uniref:molybdopterin-binding protein n=1 Tax=Rothia sp. ZJ932 TaxID=2810516 RepID=UPI0019674004|nr:molybdopterin-binding protein [Rothia sp. ZJ932]QRZ62053.1 molybdopterin molybdenumtransferase MoeA [Rothia sp. ZJ932]